MYTHACIHTTGTYTHGQPCWRPFMMTHNQPDLQGGHPPIHIYMHSYGHTHHVTHIHTRREAHTHTCTHAAIRAYHAYTHTCIQASHTYTTRQTHILTLHPHLQACGHTYRRAHTQDAGHHIHTNPPTHSYIHPQIPAGIHTIR